LKHSQGRRFESGKRVKDTKKKRERENGTAKNVKSEQGEEGGAKERGVSEGSRNGTPGTATHRWRGLVNDAAGKGGESEANVKGQAKSM